MRRLCRGLLLGFPQEDYTRSNLARQAKINSGICCLALSLWAVSYTLVCHLCLVVTEWLNPQELDSRYPDQANSSLQVYKDSECGSNVLAARVLVLWVALLVLALVVDLPFLVNRYFPRHRSLKVSNAHWDHIDILGHPPGFHLANQRTAAGLSWLQSDIMQLI